MGDRSRKCECLCSLILAGLFSMLAPACEETVSGPNRPPVAHAGADQIVTSGDDVSLSGAASRDPDGDPLTHRWELLARPTNGTNALGTTDQIETSLIPDAPGLWVVALTVHDGQLGSKRDVVQVRAIQACSSDAECDDGLSCTQDRCDQALGGCVNTPDDGLCDDGAFCNGAESCDPTTGCQAGNAVACDDGIPCTVDECDAASDSCTNQADDGNCNDGKDCTADSCDPLAGCLHPAANEGGGCSVGNCTGTCLAGVCDGCTCSQDADCDDGLFCNGVESCDANLDCQAGTAVSCDDGLSCTSDACDANTDTCTHTPDDGACDDGQFCNGAEICHVSDGCQPGLATNCDDAVGCTVDSCDEIGDTCVNAPDDNACNDGLYCNGAETCHPSNDCQAGLATNCADGVACTADSCAEIVDDCVHVPDDNACQDGLYCNGAETCDLNNDCQAGSDPCPGQSCDELGDLCVTCFGDGECDDGNFCNGVEICLGGNCQGGAGLLNGDHCDGDDRVTCTGGVETVRVTCGLGCNQGARRCKQLDPANLDPALLCANASDVVISGSLIVNTDSGAQIGSVSGSFTFSTVVQGGGAPNIGVFAANSLDVQASISTSGNNALAIVVCNDVTIGAIIDACASGRSGGPGAWSGGLTWADGSGYSNGYGKFGPGENGQPWRRTGGGGGAFGAAGGNGGIDSGMSGGEGGQAYGADSLEPLLGGSGGGGGSVNDGGQGGGGGGAVQISAGGSLIITSGGGVNVCGAGGSAPTNDARAGGGGGAGGAILLEGITVSVAGTLAANGGGGAGGVAYNESNNAEPGQDGPYGSARALGGDGATGGGGDGGQGGAAGTPGGELGQNSEASGGGGGGAGKIRINSASGTVAIGGTVSPNAGSGLFTQGTVAAD